MAKCSTYRRDQTWNPVGAEMCRRCRIMDTGWGERSEGDWRQDAGQDRFYGEGETGHHRPPHLYLLLLRHLPLVAIPSFFLCPRVPGTERQSNQSILREISPEYSLEGLMLKLKLQYFGHLM